MKPPCAGPAGVVVGAAALSLLACAAEAPAGVESVAQGLRPEDPLAGDLPPYFAPGDVVESYLSPGGSFRVHYTRAGGHRVPPGDDDGDGVPDSVQRVAQEYEAVLAFYVDVLGFAAPPRDAAAAPQHGGDDRFDVYLLDFPNRADGSFRLQACAGPGAQAALASSAPADGGPDQGAGPDAGLSVAAPSAGLGALAPCFGYMVQENDFDGRGYPDQTTAIRTLASHEFFHAIQAGYSAQLSPVVGEGTAVWASEAYAPELSDFEQASRGYLMRPERSLSIAPTTPVDPFSYGSGLFFRFLEERYGRSVVRELFEGLRQPGAPDAEWVDALDGVLRDGHASSLAEAFVEFSRWNLQTGSRASAGASYARAKDYPEVTATAVQSPFVDERVRIFPLSARYWSLSVAAKGRVRMAVDLQAQDAPSGAALRAVLAAFPRAVDQPPRWVGPEVVAAGEQAELTVQLEADTVVYAGLIGGHLRGASARPSVRFELIAPTTPEEGTGSGQKTAQAGAVASGDTGQAGSTVSGSDRDEASSRDAGGCRVGGRGQPAWRSAQRLGYVWLGLWGIRRCRRPRGGGREVPRSRDGDR